MDIPQISQNTKSYPTGWASRCASVRKAINTAQATVRTTLRTCEIKQHVSRASFPTPDSRTPSRTRVCRRVRNATAGNIRWCAVVDTLRRSLLSELTVRASITCRTLSAQARDERGINGGSERRHECWPVDTRLLGCWPGAGLREVVPIARAASSLPQLSSSWHCW